MEFVWTATPGRLARLARKRLPLLASQRMATLSPFETLGTSPLDGIFTFESRHDRYGD